MSENNSCTCRLCVEACFQIPGRFYNPKNIEAAAKLFKMSVIEFAARYLIREYRTNGPGGDIITPAPRRNFSRSSRSGMAAILVQISEITGQDGPGFNVASFGNAFNSETPCIFLSNKSRCSIYAARPGECRDAFVCRREGRLGAAIAQEWIDYRPWIDELAAGVGAFIDADTDRWVEIIWETK